jgi:predicted nicotinamide N-methyase
VNSLGVRLKYQTIIFGDIDIHVRTLKDNQQFFDKDDIAKNLGISSSLWPLFGIIWPSSKVLADFMLTFDTKKKKILEIGCGIGLTSLLLNHLDMDITATDYHPEVANYLLANTNLNHDVNIPFIRTDWADETENGLVKYDLLIGSDILYEETSIKLLSTFINRHAQEHCEIVIVDPDRANHSKFTKQMSILGFTHEKFRPLDTENIPKPYKGHIHLYTR